MKTLTLFALFLTLMVSVYSARLPRDDKAVSDVISGGEAETRSKISDFTKQISGTLSKYLDNGKQQLSTIVDKAENQLKSLRRVSSEQFNKATQSITKAVDNVRTQFSSGKKPDTPKIENPIASLSN